MTHTVRWNLHDNEKINSKVIQEAARFLRDGMTVAFPTETVYGLGADATNEEAVGKIFEAKGRPADNPLIAHVATKEQLTDLVDNLPDSAGKLIDAFSPGPITFVLPSNGTCAKNVTAGLSTIAIRIPDHPIALQLLKEADIPVAAPSANISGKPSPTTADHVWFDLNEKISGLIDGGATGVGLESTVIDCTAEIPIILRPGGITMEQIKTVVGPVLVDLALASGNKPKAPGMKYTHYAPEAPLWLVEATVDKFQEIIDHEQKNGKKIGVMASYETASRVQADQIIQLGSRDDLSEVAINLYDALRAFKNANIDLILCEAFPEEGIGQAIMNRLQKAASSYIK
ncbi:L-threonylcarbamoyladenylate synthase [Virgibacillus necropolis]|uniref:Threonylcarbamoyl-AMP synthase n=1 Tax=Virgibacillus necropolis TaxID=163877 RepID=A0A221M8V9_9BACI|nr:L-threonylcarbamoyladenylate synthase [Virgibacillus necropolis]ASN04055.1 threonylcarbamoyl-AMP synthase [Virgibacillus necropolis]